MRYYKLSNQLFAFGTDEEATKFQPDAVLITDQEADDIRASNAAQDKAAYEATLTYKELRAQAHLPIQDQMDMIYWDAVNGTTNFVDYVAAIKTAIPKA